MVMEKNLQSKTPARKVPVLLHTEASVPLGLLLAICCILTRFIKNEKIQRLREELQVMKCSIMLKKSFF